MSFLHTLFQTVQARKTKPQAGSYTNKLFELGEDEIVKKVGEEAVEVVLAVKGQGKERVISELADLYYHTLVLLAQQNITLEEVEQELERRHKK